MNTVLKSALSCFAFCILCMACNKDYKVGGDIHSSKVNQTTYDYLKGNSQGLFDTLILIIDAAGLKDAVNKQGITFFAPTDYSINSYLSYRTLQEQKVDPYRIWTLDSVMKYELPKFQDSMKAYMIDGMIAFNDLNNTGKLYSTQHDGDQAIVSYEYAVDGDPWFNPTLSAEGQPQVMFFTYMYQPIEPPIVVQDIDPDMGSHNRIQTAGLETTTGMLNVLNNSHLLFFRK